MFTVPDVIRVADLLQKVESRLGDPLTPQWAARTAAWSLSHFHRKFTSIAGESFLSYRRGRLLQRASVDLISSRRTIERIAWDAGFAHVPAFHNAFQQRYGLTPAGYRRNQMDLWIESREPLDPDFLLHVHEGRIDPEPQFVYETGRTYSGLSASGAWSEFGDLFRKFQADLDMIQARPGRVLSYVHASRQENVERRITVHVGVEAGRLPRTPSHWESFTVPSGPSAEFRHHAGTYARTCFHIWRHWSGREKLVPDSGHTVEFDWDGTNPYSGRRPLVLRIPVVPGLVPIPGLPGH